MCVPLYVGGSSYRSDIAHEKMGKMKTFFATAESSQTENIIEQTGTNLATTPLELKYGSMSVM